MSTSRASASTAADTGSPMSSRAAINASIAEPKHLDQPRCLRRRIGRVLQVGERSRCTAQSQRLAKRRHGFGRRNVLEAKEDLLQPRRVDVLGCDRQPVTGITTFHQRRHRPVGTRQHLLQPRDVTDQAPFRARRRLVTPRRIAQRINRDHRAGPDQKRAKNPARDRPPDDTSPSGPSTSNGSHKQPFEVAFSENGLVMMPRDVVPGHHSWAVL